MNDRTSSWLEAPQPGGAGDESRFRSVRHVELREDRGHVVSDGLLAEVQLGRDLRVRPALREQVEDLALALGQLGERRFRRDPREDGTAIHPEQWTRMFKRHAAAAKLPAIRLHDLRHTHGTLLVASGVHPKVVQERLGHHSSAFTMDVYAHVMPAQQAEAAARLAALVGGGGPTG